MAPTRTGFSATVARTLAELDTAGWDRLGGGCLFTSSAWLRAVDGIFAPHSAFVTARDDRDRLVAGLAAYLVEPDAYLFVNPPRLLTAAPLQGPLDALPAAERARARALTASLGPRLALRYPVAVCASPFTAESGIVGRVDHPDVAAALLDGFAEVAAGWGAVGTAVLFLAEPEHPALAAALRERGHAASLMAARCHLDLGWASFDDYVASLWRKRRWKVRNELRAFAASGLRAEVVGGERIPELVDRIAPLFANLQRRYGHDASVESARATILWVWEHLAPLTRVVLVTDAGRVVAFHLLFSAAGTVYAYLVGQTYEPVAGGASPYFEAVFYEPIRLAVAEGARRYDLGSEGYEAKLARGGRLTPTAGFFALGGDVDGEVAELLALVDAAQRERFDRLGRYRRPLPARGGA
jgi:predicted N-acyltransferase